MEFCQSKKVGILNAVFGEIRQNRLLVAPGRVGALTSGKFWICHWLVFL